jgi:hypothetical protein
MSETQQLETELLKSTGAIVEEVKKIKEVLKEWKIDVLCDELDAYAQALNAVVNKDTDPLMLNFHYDMAGNYVVYVYSKGFNVGRVFVSTETSIKDLLNVVFNSEELKKKLVKDILRIISVIASEIAEKANLVERIKSLERALDP